MTQAQLTLAEDYGLGVCMDKDFEGHFDVEVVL